MCAGGGGLVKAVVKYWSNVGERSNAGHMLVKNRSNTGQILVKYWLSAG
jgi:hypothetical protein